LKNKALSTDKIYSNNSSFNNTKTANLYPKMHFYNPYAISPKSASLKLMTLEKYLIAQALMKDSYPLK